MNSKNSLFLRTYVYKIEKKIFYNKLPSSYYIYDQIFNQLIIKQLKFFGLLFLKEKIINEVV